MTGGGAGADGGATFVRLLRISEGVDPLAFNYSFAAPVLPPDLQTLPQAEPTINVGVTVGTPISVGADGIGLITGNIIAGTVSTLNVIEGSGGGGRQVTFVITLDQVAKTDVTVTYTIVPGTASYPGDFYGGALTGTITIPAGYQGFSLTQTIVEDTLVEGNETFTIVFEQPDRGNAAQ